jgi:hypothetical protein
MTDVLVFWRSRRLSAPPSEGAIAVETIAHPGDVMSAIVGGVPEQWKRDLCAFRSTRARSCAELLEAAQGYILEQEYVRSGQVPREDVSAFIASLMPVMRYVDDQWVRGGTLRMEGVNHSVQNMLYFGTMFRENAFQDGWLVPAAYYNAMDTIIRLLGSRVPSLPSSVLSFLDVRFTASLARQERLWLKDESKQYGETVSDTISGQENITGTYHESPIRSIQFTDAEGAPARPEAGREVRDIHVVGEAQGGVGGGNAVAAVSDVGERPAVDKGGSPLQGLHQVGLDGILQKGGHRALGLQVMGGDRFVLPGVGYYHTGKAGLHVHETGGKT